jgi:hypothetical protein
MILGDRGMFADSQSWPPIRLMGEMFIRAGRITRDPITSTNGRVFSQFNRVKMNSHGKMINPGFFAHSKMLGINPGNTDTC